MRDFDDIPIWTSKKRLKLLHEFRTLIIRYFEEESTYDPMLGEPLVGEGANSVRGDINKRLVTIHRVVEAAGVNPVYDWMWGGNRVTIDIVNNVFRLHDWQMGHGVLIDTLDRVIGIYQDDQPKAWFRTFNPFYWIRQLLVGVATAPFALLGSIGVDRAKAEESVVGRVIKAVLMLLTGAAAFLTILNLTGVLSAFLLWFK